MPLELHRTIIDRLPAPVLLLNEQGEVVGFNPAARVLIESIPDLLDVLASCIRAAVARVDMEPLRLNPDPPLRLDGIRYTPWLMPALEEMALILLPEDVQQDIRHQAIGSKQDLAFSTLLNAEMLRTLRRVADQLRGPGAGSEEMLQELQHMQLLLTTIDVMCNLLQHPRSIYGERLNLQDLALQALAHRRLSSCLKVTGQSGTPGTRQFYGHAPWLLWTLDTLLDLMSASEESAVRHLNLDLLHSDSALVLTGVSDLTFTPAAAEANGPDDFTRITTLNDRQRQVFDAGTRLALASRIVEYHGGQLKLERKCSDTARELHGFQLFMPLGRVPSPLLTATPGEWVPLSQAEALARDLARLLPRHRTGLDSLSAEERDMLTHPCSHTCNQTSQ